MKASISARGFTLIEILVVIAILGIILAAAIPNLLRARMTANEVSAISSCKTICAAQHDYNNNSHPHTYTGSLMCLGSGTGAGGVHFIDAILSYGLKSGYYFTILTCNPDVIGSIWSWSATAWPISYRGTGVRSFYIDATGVIRGSDTGGAPTDISVPSLQ
jgi:type IV pilus assembly protein PilA